MIYWIGAALVFFLFQLPPVRYFFFNQVGRWAYILLYASCLSFVLTPLIINVAKKFKIVDHPAARKVHEKATPLLGGLSVIIAFYAALISNMILDREMTIVLITGFILAIVCLIDDIKGIAARVKLTVQVLMAVILMVNGIVLEIFPIATWWGQVLNHITTAIWVIGITNAMNFMDGMDGLATGLGIIISFYLGIVAFQTNQPDFGWIAVAMLGSCLGFLPFNFRGRKPALIFLGDLGSIFIGYILGAIAIMGNWSEKDPIVSFATPLLIFWVLIYDMIYITIERILTGKVKTIKDWIDYVGKDHLHHRMYTLLGIKYWAVLFIFLISLTLGVTAITLRNARSIDGILLVIQAALITIILSILDYFGRRRANQMIFDKKGVDD